MSGMDTVNILEEKMADNHLPSFSVWEACDFRAVITAMAKYSDRHNDRYGSRLGADYVLGDAWFQVLDGMRGLLNGELGPLSGYAGDIDRILVTLMEDEGFDVDMSTVTTIVHHAYDDLDLHADAMSEADEEGWRTMSGVQGASD